MNKRERSDRHAPASLGHKFGPDLYCQNEGCNVDWDDFRLLPTPCQGKRKSIKVTHVNRKSRMPFSIFLQQHGIRQCDIAREAGCRDYAVTKALARSMYSHPIETAIVVRAAVNLLRQQGIDIRSGMHNLLRELRSQKESANAEAET